MLLLHKVIMSLLRNVIGTRAGAFERGVPQVSAMHLG